MSLWTLVRVMPQSQQGFMNYIAEYQKDIEAYYPVYYKEVRNPNGRERKSHRRIQVPVPVYPGYVFLKEEVAGSRLVGCPVKVSYVRFGNSVGVVREDVIDGLKRLEAAGVLVTEKMVENPYWPGRVVRVHTPVMSLYAIVLGCTHSRNYVTVDTQFSRMTVPITHIQLDLGE